MSGGDRFSPRKATFQGGQWTSPALRVVYRVGQKTGPQTRDRNSVKSLTDLPIFSLEDSLVNLQLCVNAPCTCCYTTLWNISVSKTAINYKLQGSVATYLRCDGVVNNQIKKGSLLSLRVEEFF